MFYERKSLYIFTYNFIKSSLSYYNLLMIQQPVQLDI